MIGDGAGTGAKAAGDGRAAAARRRADDHYVLPPGQEPHDPNRSRWIPWAIVGAFLVVFAVNGVMVFFAIDTFSGLSTDDAYRKGLAFNRALSAAEAQSERGWQVETRIAQNGVIGARVDLILKDKAGVPIKDAEIVANFVRPTASGHDVERPLRHEGEGRYALELKLPFPGQWEVRLDARVGEERWSAVDRLVLR